MDPDGMKNVWTTNCLTSRATTMATPSRIGNSFQNEPLLLLVCSSITHGAYAANLRTTITGDVSYIYARLRRRKAKGNSTKAPPAVTPSKTSWRASEPHRENGVAITI